MARKNMLTDQMNEVMKFITNSEQIWDLISNEKDL